MMMIGIGMPISHSSTPFMATLVVDEQPHNAAPPPAVPGGGGVTVAPQAVR